MSDPELANGWVDVELAAEFPGLRLVELCVEASAGRSTPAVRQRLSYLSSRMTGAQAVEVRNQPVAHAYRVFFRHVGLDPDEHRVPAEQVVVDRLFKGAYAPDNRVDDAITVAVAETQVPVWALDHERLDGPLGIRPGVPGERLGTDVHANEVPGGRLLLADAAGAVGVLFGPLATSHLVTSETTAVRLFSVQVPNVPSIHVEEAMWTAVECLAAG